MQRMGHAPRNALVLIAALNRLCIQARSAGCYRAHLPTAMSPGDICVAESHRDIRVCAYSQQQVCRVLHPLSASVALNALETTDLIASTFYVCYTQADTFAQSHYSRSTLVNITQSSCEARLQNVCSQVDGSPEQPSPPLCCRS